jgi:hypothetical protein
MKATISNAQSIIGIIIVIACFFLMAVYVVQGRAPDAVIAGLIGTALGAVLGFFFGHANGTTSALAIAATALANRTNPGDTVNPARPGIEVIP